jgi:tetratricopeptide (TPR) repeat protein
LMAFVVLAMSAAAAGCAALADTPASVDSLRGRYRLHVESGEYDMALVEAKALTEACEEVHGPDSGETAIGHVLQAVCHAKLGSADSSRAARTTAMCIAINNVAISVSTKLTAYIALARCSCDLGDYDEAVALARLASELRSRCSEKTVARLIEELNSLADSLRSKNLVKEAEYVFLLALAVSQDKYKTPCAERIEQLETVAEFYEDRGMHSQASRFRDEALAEAEALDPPEGLFRNAVSILAARASNEARVSLDPKDIFSGSCGSHALLYANKSCSTSGLASPASSAR